MRAEDLSAWSPGKAEKWHLAFAEMLEAAFYAQDLGQSLWDFAVDVQLLTAAGLTANDLRWLNTKHYVEHKIEVSKPGILQNRRFRPAGAQLLGPRSCIVLTAAGVDFAQQFCIAPPREKRRPTFASTASKPRSFRVLRWDLAGRRFFLGSILIKAFRVPASNQQLILTAFEEQGWPDCIDDPLHPKDGLDPKRRVRDAVAGLNRSHKRRMIRFGSNGSGSGIRWDRVHAQK